MDHSLQSTIFDRNCIESNQKLSQGFEFNGTTSCIDNVDISSMIGGIFLHIHVISTLLSGMKIGAKIIWRLLLDFQPATPELG